MQIAKGVKSCPMQYACDILVVESTSEFWQDPLNTQLAFTSDAKGFVWLDPPAGTSAAVLETLDQRLRANGIPHRIGKPATADAAIPQAVVTPAQLSQSIRDVVLEMVEEAVLKLPSINDCMLLRHEVEAALDKVGLCESQGSG